ncbi:Wzz/FepE/Etk N-terminal domain-containing protein [Desulfobacter vibrioformis]|uniref:Wzz/FepE/Etk N-terminal domain-containing protein n=1 Tax=Desulfobacter vibrioformis TaxID=34031 RepID=UPI0005505FA7|nr:Wzz/FepE/Etk N-terminal domain-containing protein [Desulfobacter vibrioformis]
MSDQIKQSEKEFVYIPVPQMDQEDEIDLLELWNVIWKGKWFIFGFTLLTTLIAVYVTLYVLPVTYKSDIVLQPTETTSNSGLSALATNLPISLPISGGDNKNENIVSFLNSRTIKQRLIEKYNLLPKIYPEVWDTENQKWEIDDPEDQPTILKAIQEKFKDIYTIEKDEKTSLITISWIDQYPKFTKTMLLRTVKELEYYLENEYESDAKREREFVDNQLKKSEKELEYWEKQIPSDKLTLSKIQRERLASLTVYTELRKQLELAKISEVKEIIRFKVLDQPFVPEEKFKPKRLMICALTIVVAGFLSIFLLFLKQFSINLRTKSKLDSKI